MALEYNMNSEIGKLRVVKNNFEGEVKICGGNCLAIFIFEQNEVRDLLFAIFSVQHGLNMINQYGTIFPYRLKQVISKVELNASHPNYRDLADLLILSFINFETYYKDIEEDVL